MASKGVAANSLQCTYIMYEVRLQVYWGEGLPTGSERSIQMQEESGRNSIAGDDRSRHGSGWSEVWHCQ